MKVTSRTKGTYPSPNSYSQAIPQALGALRDLAHGQDLIVNWKTLVVLVEGDDLIAQVDAVRRPPEIDLEDEGDDW